MRCVVGRGEGGLVCCGKKERVDPHPMCRRVGICTVCSLSACI